MKKYLFTLIVMAVVLVPGIVEAQAEFSFMNYTSNCADDICTASIDIYMGPTGDSVEIDSELTGDVVEGRLVRSVKVIDSSSDYVFSITGNLDSNEASLAPEPLLDPLTEEVFIATVEWTFDDDPDKTEEDCAINIDLSGTDVVIEPQITPETGVSLPVVILGIAAIAGLGVYMVTRKNTKLFKI